MAGEPELAIGDANEWVGYLQALLTHNGLPLTEDGHFGEATKHQLEQFQHAKGLPATGIADAKTWSHLTGEADPQVY